MKYVLIIILALLAGCEFKVEGGDIRARHIKAANELCHANGGLNVIFTNIGSFTAVCNNGATFKDQVK